MRTARRRADIVPVEEIMSSLADYLHRQAQTPDPEVLIQAIAAGIHAATENGSPQGVALARLLAAIGETNSAIFASIADKLDFITTDSAGSA
jgi:hypothetical protein